MRSTLFVLNYTRGENEMEEILAEHNDFQLD